MTSTLSFRNLIGKKIVLVVLAAVIALAGLWFWRGKTDHSASFRLAAVTKGDLEVTVSATGTVEPEELVDVGSQVAGRIVAFGKDKNGKPIDYGSAVEAGMVLARIDDSLFAAEVSQAKAQLAQARANVQRAEADLGQLKAKLIQTESDWLRAEKLGPSEALSQSDFDAARSNYDVARANLKVGQAALRQTKEAVAQSEAVLKKANQNLDYCTIRSPVKGVIIDRRVNIGQTVVASLNAPSLFLIAKDLTRLQIWVAVNEADIGNIRVGQPVSFTVDTFPQNTFEGTVGKVRLNATMTQNVVTYTVEVNTDNSDGKLMPYLTANVKFLLATRQDVFMAPNAALRWFPRSDQIAPTFRDQYADAGGTGSGTGGAASAKDKKEARNLKTLWIPDGSYVRPVQVQVGLSDGSLTEIQGPEVKEGLQVIVAEEQQEGAPPNTSSPFTPKLFRDKRPSPRQ
jgi:HlyD family secretion protein